MIRVLLIDDHPAVRAGIQAAIAKTEDILAVGEAANGADALRLLDELDPDVALLDCRLPEVDGITVAETARLRKVRTRFLALSAYTGDQYVRGMLQAGAAGYALKDEDIQTVLAAIRVVAQGKQWFSQPILDKVVAWARGDAAVRSGVAELSERELQVLRLLARGWDNERIANTLVITEGTVKNYLSSIYDKLDAHSRGEVVALAWKLGFVDTD